MSRTLASSLQNYLDTLEFDFIDSIGFSFDPYIAQDKPSYDHFMELTFLKNYQWVNTRGEIVNMQKMKHADLRYLVNIAAWCIKNHEDVNPYTDTIQFRYIQNKIVRLNKKVSIARKILSRPMGWSLNMEDKETKK